MAARMPPKFFDEPLLIADLNDVYDHVLLNERWSALGHRDVVN